jgi:hypothetical protein
MSPIMVFFDAAKCQHVKCCKDRSQFEDRRTAIIHPRRGLADVPVGRVMCMLRGAARRGVMGNGPQLSDSPITSGAATLANHLLHVGWRYTRQALTPTPPPPHKLAGGRQSHQKTEWDFSFLS